MAFSEDIRNRLFWLYDSFTGRIVHRHYLDIKHQLESGNKDSVRERTHAVLNRLLSHASRTVPFYRKIRSGAVLEEFPVVNKNIIRDSYMTFFSTEFDRRKLYHVTTSGSTGTPFTVYQDKNKRLRHIADNIYFNSLAGVPPGMRLYYFRIWNKLNRKSHLTFRIQNIIPEDATILTDSTFELFRREVEKAKGISALLAYASTYEAFGSYLERHDLMLENKFSSVISMSETLPLKTKVQLTARLKCPVISRYSNMENGFIAQQCIADSHEYHLNIASFHIEILELEKDIPVEPGNTGRIVITDLFNFAMPLIRYDTGDIGAVEEESKCGMKTPILAHIEGRRVDFIYDASGLLLSPHLITNTLWKYSEIVQFQFIQQNLKQYTLKLNMGEDKKYFREQELIDELKSYLGNVARIDIEYVNEIPTLASGKRKKIINMLFTN